MPDEVNNTTIFTTATPENTDSMSGSKIGIIATISLVIFVILVICGYIGYRKLKQRRRSHGEYRPQFEEYQHAKNLPYLQPPKSNGTSNLLFLCSAFVQTKSNSIDHKQIVNQQKSD
ncbi:Uncharacterized protein ACO02O_04389 [Dirofilaria immitis]